MLNKDEDQTDPNYLDCARFTIMILRRNNGLESNAPFNIIEQSTRIFKNIKGEISPVDNISLLEFKDIYKIEGWMLEIF